VEGKRSYTVPVLLVIITVMTILLVLVYSKLLLAEQNRTSEEGGRLAEQYRAAAQFAQRLSDGAGLLAAEDSLVKRLAAKEMLGEAASASGDVVSILTEAAQRSSGHSREQAMLPIAQAMKKIMGEEKGPLGVRQAAEHEGPLTAAEKDMLTAVSEGAAQMLQALEGFRVPTGVAGYRNMSAGEGWIEPALAAGKALEETAAKLK
jgi:hypothetical protein